MLQYLPNLTNQKLNQLSELKLVGAVQVTEEALEDRVGCSGPNYKVGTEYNTSPRPEIESQLFYESKNLNDS